MSTALGAASARAQVMIEDFDEYASDAALQAAWVASSGTVSLSPYVASGSTNAHSLCAQLSVGSDAYDTTIIAGPTLTAPLSIYSTQYVSFRVAGDPEFTNGTYQQVFVYAYDASGNFGRWGASIPTANTNWQVLNLAASGITAPWNSPGLPNLAAITQFSFYIYGQGSPAGNAYDARIYLADLQTCNSPLSNGGTTPKQQTIEDFDEYASNADLLAAWAPLTSTLSLSSYVDASSSSTNSLCVQVNFPSVDWATEVLTGPVLTHPVAIGANQYLTVRVAGDPEFTNASWQQIYVYAYDANGNFGRWGSAIPSVTTNWQVLNLAASGIAAPWNSPGLPDLTAITQFSFYIYGQGSPAGNAYNATLYLSDLQIRNAPLVEAPPPSAVRGLIDNFEAYANDAALRSFYTYVDSPAATTLTASLLTPAPQGNKAAALAIDFASGQYPWAALLSPVVTPFSFPTNAQVSFWFKGDPTLASVADGGTEFWLTFYDEGGNAFTFNTDAGPVISSGWTNIVANYSDFWSTSTPDTGNLVQWRILVEGWTGTADSQSLNASFAVDNIVILLSPTLSISTAAGVRTLRLSHLISGNTYTVAASSDLSTWTAAATIKAASASATWAVPSGQKGFFRVSYTP